FAVSRQRARDAGLQDEVRFLLEDYRNAPDTYDRIVSVGMFEHVGRPNYLTFFRKAASLLKPDGVMLLHTIGRTDAPTSNNPFIEKYIFPGGYIPALSEVMRAVEKSGLRVTDIEILRLHYAETLRHWRQRFMARRDEAKALYDERFCRIWEFYLASSESAFRWQNLVVFQLQLAHEQQAVPLTRDYVDQGEGALKAREGDGKGRAAGARLFPQDTALKGVSTLPNRPSRSEHVKSDRQIQP
ncbi:MAG TPA: cyclopropane-fatty-acyl-phospholipid synthase family protein, partial [Mycoplana sp.]|nr:cyclopropane-fatty-acyl-phospholipid synthase family protein [Mycoplana sp.]